MATRRKTTRRTVRFTYTAPYWMLELSFWLVIIIGICMAVIGMLNAFHSHWGWSEDVQSVFIKIANWVKNICMTLALIVPVLLGYHVARSKGAGWFILWLIFAILILFGIVTTLL